MPAQRPDDHAEYDRMAAQAAYGAGRSHSRDGRLSRRSPASIAAKRLPTNKRRAPYRRPGVGRPTGRYRLRRGRREWPSTVPPQGGRSDDTDRDGGNRLPTLNDCGCASRPGRAASCRRLRRERASPGFAYCRRHPPGVSRRRERHGSRFPLSRDAPNRCDPSAPLPGRNADDGPRLIPGGPLRLRSGGVIHATDREGG